MIDLIKFPGGGGGGVGVKQKRGCPLTENLLPNDEIIHPHYFRETYTSRLVEFNEQFVG